MITAAAVLSLVGGTLIMMVIGSLYTFGALAPYIASFLHYRGSPDTHIRDLNLISPVSYFTLPIGMIMGTWLATKVDLRIVITIGFVIYGAVLAALSYVQVFVGWVLLYGLCLGFSQGLPYMLPINNCFKYFPNKKGTISGICIAGLGFGALVFNQIIFALINPDNQHLNKQGYFPPDVADRLPSTIRVLAAVYFGMAMVGNAMIRPYKGDKLVVDQERPLSQIELLTDYNNDCPTVLGALKENIFYRLMALVALSSSFGIYIAFNYKQYGLTQIDDDSFLTLAGSVGAIANGASRFFWGSLLDKIPFKILVTLINIVLLVAAVTFPLVLHIKAMFMIYVVVIYFAYGGLYSIYPASAYKIFGQLHGARIYSILFFGFSIGSLIQFLLHNFMVDRYGKEGHQYSFWAFAGLQGVAIVLVLVTKWRIEWATKSSILTTEEWQK